MRRSLRVHGSRVPIYVSPDAQLKYLKPGRRGLDPDLVSLAERFVTANSRVWDIGANIGVFSFASAAIALNGEVVAVEADVWLVGLLRRSARLAAARGSRVAVVPAAASSRTGVAQFLVAQRGRASNALASAGGRTQMGGTRETQFVPTVTLDSLLDTFEAPHFVKIDVEGAEVEVLRGAATLLARHRPAMYIEVGYEHVTTIIDIMSRAGYASHNADGVPADATTLDNVLWLPVSETN